METQFIVIQNINLFFFFFESNSYFLIYRCIAMHTAIKDYKYAYMKEKLIGCETGMKNTTTSHQ